MKRVLLRGPVLSRSGYGEHARFIFRALMDNPSHFDVHIDPTPWGASSWIMKDTEETKLIKACVEKHNMYKDVYPTYDICFQVMIPNEFQKIAKVNIGITAAVETDRASGQWIQACNTVVDKVLVVSEHAKKSLTDPVYTVLNEQTQQPVGSLKCTVPVEVVGYPVKYYDQVDLDIELENDFNFITVAQDSPRKNLTNSIRWFLDEFRNDDVGLVIKCHKMNHSVPDKFHVTDFLNSIVNAPEYRDRKCKVYLLHGNLTDEELHSLYKHPKIKSYFTATHGEGFGLPIYEAAYSGLPIAAPAWSGQVDFLYANQKNKKSGKIKRVPMFSKIRYELKEIQPEAVWEAVLVPESKWCYVEEDHFRKTLRECYDKNNIKKKQAEELKTYLEKEFSAENQYKKFFDSVSEYLTESEEDADDGWQNILNKVVSYD